ncbi:hypothetical protein INQ51_21400 [Maribellus sp. CM-23]|uniref:DUF3240 domain-containing protein n=1 Tax=Maribellus luteus TaxID=2305463 RepID=A0A399SVE2_9BACT|nr:MULTISPECIES: hypothetical protein [Maribellus]MCE4566892.1 hypothetical protein [Maribellus sp. CM-23]RIJ48010.1 hypothetical protein D1614_12910 [Maribellus luteus]
MKFVMIQCVEAHHHNLAHILEQLHINSYSETEVEGFMKDVEGKREIANWFGSARRPYRYIISFTFLEEDRANELLRMVKEFNDSFEAISPINAYIMNVEKYV